MFQRVPFPHCRYSTHVYTHHIWQIHAYDYEDGDTEGAAVARNLNRYLKRTSRRTEAMARAKASNLKCIEKLHKT